jgi:unsaturated rhamnogalacturonyl hydrolase
LERFHYIWEDTTNSGFSILGRNIDLLGADLDTLQTAPADSSLKKFSVYIIVDPDTPAETKDPHYISEQDAAVIERWVKNGGVLALFGNDKGNCEFEHLNKLSERFGIHFNEDSQHKVLGKAWEMGKNDQLPDHPIFKDVKQIYTKEVSTFNAYRCCSADSDRREFHPDGIGKIGKRDGLCGR